MSATNPVASTRRSYEFDKVIRVVTFFSMAV